MIRSCANCLHYKKLASGDGKTGYCHQLPLLFAYTMEQSVFAITKDFCLCEKHKFSNEDILELNSEKVDMKTILKSKKDVD